MAKRGEPVTAEQRREHWRQTLRQWQASGLSQAEFCRCQGLRNSQFAWWKRRLRGQAAGRQHRGTAPSPGPPAFVPLGTVRLASSPRLEVALTNGRRLRLGPELPPQQLTGLVAVLDGPAAPGKAAPDVWVHFRIAAFCAGLGAIGWGRVFLTPQFGPRQRLGVVLTDAELEGDPLYAGPSLCDRRMACVRDSPGDALSRTESVKVTAAGRELEFSRLDVGRCYHSLGGGDHCRPFNVELKPVYEYARSVCAGRGCIRSCMDHLEKQDKLTNRFSNPFRTRPCWTIDGGRTGDEREPKAGPRGGRP